MAALKRKEEIPKGNPKGIPFNSPAIERLFERFKANYVEAFHPNSRVLHDSLRELEIRKQEFLRFVTSDAQARAFFIRIESLDNNTQNTLTQTIWGMKTISPSRVGQVIGFLRTYSDLHDAIPFSKKLNSALRLTMYGQGRKVSLKSIIERAAMKKARRKLP